MFDDTCTFEPARVTYQANLRLGRGPETASRCRGCAAHGHCPRDLLAAQMAPSELDSLLCPLRLAPRHALYREDDPFASIYLVRSGSLKSETAGQNDRGQIVGLHLPGDVVGTDGIATERRATTVVALERAEVCAIPFAGLARMMHDAPEVQRWLHRALGREMARSDANVALLRSATAEGRIASFLVDLSRRLSPTDAPAAEVPLTASRGDIAGHLGLTRETVCRVFAKLHRLRILDGNLTRVRICDQALLSRLAAGAAEPLPDPSSGVRPRANAARLTPVTAAAGKENTLKKRKTTSSVSPVGTRSNRMTVSEWLGC